MNPEIKELWLSALRSGEYIQGVGRLVDLFTDGLQPRFCCLGVLCDLAEKAGVVKNHKSPEGVVLYDDKHDLLPQSVMDWAGLAYNNPWFEREGSVFTLAVLNDDGASFSDIADKIETFF